MQTCILGYSQLVKKMGVNDLDLQGNFGHFDSRIMGNLACPHDNLKWIWVKITKFACMHLGIFSTGTGNKVIDFDLQGHLAIWTRIGIQRHFCIMI